MSSAPAWPWPGKAPPDGEAAIESMLARHHSLRDAFPLHISATSDPAKSARAIERLQRKWDHIENRQAALRVRQAAKIPLDRLTVSPLFLQLCVHAGLDPAAVAAATVTSPVPLLPGDGHPWLATATPEHREAVAEHIRLAPKFVAGSVHIRREDDPRGGAKVARSGPSIGAGARLGRAVFAPKAAPAGCGCRTKSRSPS